MNKRISINPTAEFELRRWTNAPLQLVISAEFKTTPAVLFELLSNHEHWPELFPWVHEVTIDNTHTVIPNGLGAKRICNFGQGMILEEIIVGWDPPHMYAYAGIDETHPFGMTGHVGVVQCTASQKGVKLLWQHYFSHPNPAAMLVQLEGNMKAAVTVLTRKFNQ